MKEEDGVQVENAAWRMQSRGRTSGRKRSIEHEGRGRSSGRKCSLEEAEEGLQVEITAARRQRKNFR
jgi:hypothetical protein